MIQKEIHTSSFKEKHRSSKKDFTRNRILSFPVLVTSILNRMSKSINVEINQFLSRFVPDAGSLVSKQSYSEARYKLKHGAFIDLNDKLISAYYKRPGFALYENKYLLLATDGTTYRLPYQENFKKEFDHMDNGQTQAVIAKGVKIYDVLNRLTLASQLTDYHTTEEKNFENCWIQVHQTIDLSSHRVILLADRHYPSFSRIIALNRQGVDFVFRCKSDFCNEVKQFLSTSQTEGVITIDLKKKSRRYNLKRQGVDSPPESLQVRLVRIPSQDGKDKLLMSSIVEEGQLTREQVQELYRLRWRVETSFDLDKNKMEVENFSAKTVEGIKQDFYAALLTTNLAELIIANAQQELDSKQDKKNNKYRYQINRAVAIGLMKDQIPNFYLAKESPDQFYNRMTKLFLRFKEPIREGRSFPRKAKHKLKYPTNTRRVV